VNDRIDRLYPMVEETGEGGPERRWLLQRHGVPFSVTGASPSLDSRIPNYVQPLVFPQLPHL
jgi:hypothetical protein